MDDKDEKKEMKIWVGVRIERYGLERKDGNVTE